MILGTVPALFKQANFDKCNQLKNIDGKIVMKDIKKFNLTVIEALNTNISTNILIGISFHLACMVDRIKDNQFINEFEGKESFIKENLSQHKKQKKPASAGFFREKNIARFHRNSQSENGSRGERE